MVFKFKLTDGRTVHAQSDSEVAAYSSVVDCFGFHCVERPTGYASILVLDGPPSVALELRIRTIGGICIEMEFHDVESPEAVQRSWRESQK